MGKGKIAVEKKPYLKKSELLFSEKEKILNRFKGKIFPTKNTEPEPAPTVFATLKEKKNRLRNLHLNFMQILIRKLYAMKQIWMLKYFSNVLRIKMRQIATRNEKIVNHVNNCWRNPQV